MKATPLKIRRYRQISRTVRCFLRDYWTAHGYGPTLDEIRQALAFNSISATRNWLYEMRDRHDLLFEEEIARSFRLPGQRTIFPDEP